MNGITTADGDTTPQDRRHGSTYSIEELRNIDKDFVNEVLDLFNMNLQELEGEINILENGKKDIDTEETRSILKGIEQLCDDIDNLVEEHKIKK